MGTSDRAVDVPLVSIVVPAYNAGANLPETLESVRAQTLTSWELVVFDDGSTDDTATVAARAAAADGRVRVCRGPNLGVAEARNRGLAATDRRSPYVILLDSDDLWQPDALRSLVEALEHDPAAPAAHCTARSIDEEGRPIPGDTLETFMRNRRALTETGYQVLGAGDATTFGALLVANYTVTPGTMLLRREALERLLPYDPALAPADDWDIALRTARIAPIAFVDRPLLSWRRHPSSLSAVSTRWRIAHRRARRKSVEDPANTRAERALAVTEFRHSGMAKLRAGLADCRRGDLRTGARSAVGGVEALMCATAAQTRSALRRHGPQ